VFLESTKEFQHKTTRLTSQFTFKLNKLMHRLFNKLDLQQTNFHINLQQNTTEFLPCTMTFYATKIESSAPHTTVITILKYNAESIAAF